jgi:N-acyl-D-aspartate/D-glutamate deacylase
MLTSPSMQAGWENYLDLVGPEQVLLAGARGWPEVEGRTIAELQAEWGTGMADTVTRLLDGTGGDAAIVLTELYDQETIERIAAEPFGCFSTDSVHSSLPHPRLFGTYPYAFRTLCIGGIISESEFVERSSRRPAQILGIELACAVQAGAAADLVVVDPRQFSHVANYRAPWQPVTGLQTLVLGGQVIDVTPNSQPLTRVESETSQ